MRLADGCSWDALLAATSYAMAKRIAPFELPALATTDRARFLALGKNRDRPPLQALADACVQDLDRYRAPPSEAELARRRRAKLTEAQETMLVRFGYPYVLETWFFHMTLDARLSVESIGSGGRRQNDLELAATRSRGLVADVCLFTQTNPGAPIVIAERVALRG